LLQENNNSAGDAKDVKTARSISSSRGGGGGSGGGEEDDHSLISNKTASNLLLIITHLYNLRVVHHSLVMDIFFLLINEHEHEQEPPIAGSSSRRRSEYSGLTALRVELIVCIVENCGQGLRGDDPGGLKQGIVKVMKMTQSSRTGEGDREGGEGDRDRDRVVRDVDRGRVKFMLEALSDLKNNKSSSRRQQSAQAESVQHMRRWIGRVKVAAAGAGALSSPVLSCSVLSSPVWYCLVFTWCCLVSSCPVLLCLTWCCFVLNPTL
jgi:hypothetical protein